MGCATVLCVDDSPQALKLRKAALESCGYHVEIASSGSAAMRMLKRVSVAAIVLEYKLEGMDAEAAACHIKRQFPSVPVILLSAFSEIPERILWLVDECVMKRGIPEGLIPVLQRIAGTESADGAHKLAPRSPDEQGYRGDA